MTAKAAPGLAALAITARQPRRTPSSPANGITTALFPEKPITSQGMKRSAAGLDHDAGADRHRVDGTRDLDHQAAHADHPAIDIDAIDVADLFGQSAFIAKTLSFDAFQAVPLTSCLPASLIIASLSLVTESARPSEGRSSCGSRLGPPLNVELERDWIQKAASTQYLRAIRKKLHDQSLRNTNQILLTICGQDPNQLFKGVLSAASAADLTPGAATIGDWHARIADRR